MVPGVGDFVYVLGAERGRGGEGAERELGLGDAVTAMDADAVGGGEGDSRRPGPCRFWPPARRGRPCRVGRRPRTSY